MLRIGLDVGSTTLKCVVIDEKNNIIYDHYERHFSQISSKTAGLLKEIESRYPAEQKALCISGSAGMGFATRNGVQFIQEVYSTRIAVKKLVPDADAVIELGGEDAKILFLTGMPEVRMNGTCAGGTGAFIDQISTLLGVSPTEMNELARQSEKKCSIASRCGVFAKSDIQPLLNQGAKKSDISAGVFAAVVNQTIAGLAQGRMIKGKILYLGGPLTFFSYLRAEFDLALNNTGICPENSLYYVAYGAALSCDCNAVDLLSAAGKMESFSSEKTFRGIEPLFESKEEYDDFVRRHYPPFALAELKDDKKAYIGIDAGSTTVKCVVMNSDEEAVYTEYMTNSGNPVPLVKRFLERIYEKYPDIRIVSSASTGYGEDIVKSAFGLDHGIVETVAHFFAARKYDPYVDFIIDIGGQDIKCFKIHNGGIENIYLNEACSSGCGSFLQTFATNLGYTPEEFASLGIFAKSPVDLGSRCTVFMNSSVKQAQKDGATIGDISAGLSVSVVKNALYKVIRVVDKDALGDHIVVQGGTFLNNAVLRAFEKELGKNVVRPSLSGLMGAYGAALYTKSVSSDTEKSAIITADELKTFLHEASAINCAGCSNRCRLTVNTFSVGGKEKKEKFIGGNRCERPIKGKSHKSGINMYAYKRSLLSGYGSFKGKRAAVGLPMVLNMFELLPFWHTFFKELGFGVELSPESCKELYFKGQSTIPSDTACYPAKLVHGHIQALLESEAEAIFYPCMTYNIDENAGDNHYNCPVVAYYPEVIASNADLAGK
ncbi:MAG: 2-hydroxyglutaryl-CoA dehydratase, partial [Clostridia bacterium]|nr:2-hydroxyglutaryl-CoA dehydratase [Clostridia bacterium]